MKEKKSIDKITKLCYDFNKSLVNKQIEEEKTNRPSNNEGSFVCFKNIQKIYPNGYYAVCDFNLDIKQGEFIVLVGPSGCGKTTTLRMVCGLENITAGALYIDGVYSNSLEPKDRGLSMVFQNYALFPHFSVYDNLAYGLKIKKILAPVYDKEGKQVVGIDYKRIKDLQKEKAWYLQNDPESGEIANIDHDIDVLSSTPIPLMKERKLTKEEIDEKIQKAAEILNLKELLARKPGQLSGGQCQRVALGRVIVSDSKLLLMDEPLSNLDAKLRVSMRGEIINLHKTLKATTIYVTHDQVEAMTMADRIVIMDRTLIKQIGTPTEVYEHPNCLFVATFIGSPTMNIIDASINGDEIIHDDIGLIKEKGLLTTVNDFYKKYLLELLDVQAGLATKYQNVDLLEYKSNDIENKINVIRTALESNVYPLKFGIRPESILIADPHSRNKVKATILSYELLGNEYNVNIKVGSSTLLMKLPNTFECEIGKEINVIFDVNKYHIFDSISERAIN